MALTRWMYLLTSMGLLLVLAGCPDGGRTSNQGGGSIITAGAKLAGGNIGDLTPDEFQILCDNAPVLLPQLAPQYGVDVNNVEIPTLSDEDAQLVVDYLGENSIQTLDDLVNAINAGTLTDPPQALLDLVMPFIGGADVPLT